VYVYRGMIIQETDIREKIKLEAHILNKNNERTMILYNSEWKVSVGP